MPCWSAENATKAYLRALKMGKRGKEPDIAEFISAIAAGNNAQLMVMTCAGVAGSTALALVAAACQTGGRVVCILNSLDCLDASKNALGNYGDCVNFVTGDAKKLLINDYRSADFVLVDCNISDHKGVLRAAEEGTAKNGGALIVGYNALHKRPYWGSTDEFNTHFLPIGEGLLVIRKGAPSEVNDHGVSCRKRSRWVVKIDKWTGEEHVFRITSPFPKELKALGRGLVSGTPCKL